MNSSTILRLLAALANIGGLLALLYDFERAQLLLLMAIVLDTRADLIDMRKQASP